MSNRFEVEVSDAFPIGREALIKDSKHGGEIVGGRVIDRITGERKAKKIRITTGEHAGDVLQLGEFSVVEFI